MKKTIKLLCGIMCLFMVMTVVLTGCDFGNVDVAHGKDQTPIYYGMLLFDSSDVQIPEVNYVDEPSNSSDNQYGWYKDDNGLVRSIHDKHEPLYVSQNQDVYAYVGISNPSEFQIVSFVINGQMFTSDMFDARSTNEVKIVKLNVGNARGIVEYTVSDIKYADGKEIKNVYMLGDPVAKASVKAENQITATVNKVELKDSGKEIFFDITITDEYGLIASGNGNVKLLVYRDGKVQKEAELTVGENKITIETLNKNKEHEYEIVAYYDDFSGNGSANHTLVSKYPLQKDHSHTFGDWETTKAPTCGKDGEKARICSGCGTSETEKLSATGLHSFDNNCDATCNGCEFTRAVGDHVYDDQYDDTCNECGFVRDADCKHVYDNDCDTICNACGEIRTVDPSVHVYDNACDTTCNVCGATRTAGGHSYASTVTPPTATENGAITYTCSNCGNTYSETIVPQNFTVTADNRAMVGYTGAENENLVIPAVFENNGTWYRVTKIGNDAFRRCDNLASVTIGDSVTTINDAAFCGCSKLANITFGNSVTIIGYNAFRDCYNLTSITIPDSVTTIDSCAFYFCTNVTSVTIGDSVTTIGRFAFANCYNLASVTIPDSVNTISDYAFYYCQRLTSITIPGSVSTIGIEAFSICSNLTSILVDEQNETYQSINGNLYSKDGTVLVAYANGKPDASFIIPAFVTTIRDSAFAWSPHLISVTIGDSVETIGNSVFYKCDNLTHVYYVGTEEKWATIAIAENNDILLNATRFYYSETQPTTAGNFWHWVDGVPTVWDAYVAPETPGYSVGLEYTSNGDGTCYVSGIGTCTDADVIIPPTAPNGDKVTSIGRLSCNDNLISVVIPEGVTRIEDWAFDYNWFLESVLIPDSVTTIGEYAFAHCFYLTNITISDNVTSIGQGAFLGCGIRLTSITVGENNPYYYVDGNCLIERSTKALLKGCNSSTIPQYVTSICDGAFYFCQELTTVTLPDTVTSIGSQAFQECSKLVSVTIPDSVTTIGLQAFLGCESLTSVAIGKGIASIDRGAFSSCDPLTYVYYGGTETEWCEIEMDDYTKGDLILFLYYYSETQPTTEGNYWHWVDGVPTVWEVEIHTHSYTSTVTPPTATENGVITYTCSCTDSYTEELIPQDFTVTADNRAMVGYTGAEGENLVIPAVFEDNGAWYRVTAIGDYAFYCCNIESVEFAQTITSIGIYAFARTSLKNIVIPDSIVNLGSYSYQGCVNAETIIIGNGVTEIGACTFGECYSLLSVTIGKNVTNINFEAFRPSKPVEVINKSSLPIVTGTWSYGEVASNAIEVHTGETKIQKLGDFAFYVSNDKAYLVRYLGSEKNVVLPESYNGKSYSIYAYAFSYGAYVTGEDVTSVVIPDNVTSIGFWAFNDSLESVYYTGTAEDWDIITIDESNDDPLDVPRYYYSETEPTTEGNFWHYVDGVPTVWEVYVDPNYSVGLEYTLSEDGTYYIVTGRGTCADADIKIPATYNNLPVKAIGADAFREDNVITSIETGANITTIGANSFCGCSSLEKITITKDVSVIKDLAFAYCDSLKEIYYDAIEASVSRYTDYYSYNAFYNDNENASDILLIIGKNVVKIPDNMFNGREQGVIKITSVQFEEGSVCQSIGLGAFYCCRYLKEINIPSSVKYISKDAFYHCNNLKTVILNEGLISIGDWAFYGCNSLESIYIPSTVESIDKYTYLFCTDSVNTITVHKDNKYYHSEGNCLIETATNALLQGCKNSVIPDYVTTIYRYAFQYCTKLNEIVIPESVAVIEDYAFYGCKDLTIKCEVQSKPNGWSEDWYWAYETSINVIWGYLDGETESTYSVGLVYTLNEDGQSYSVTGIGTCTDTDIVIPNEYEGLPVTIIGSDSFSFYSHITSVTIGNSVTTIGDAAFSHCQNLASVIIPNSVTSIGIAAFDACVNLNVTFANPNGWWCQNRYDATNVQAIAASVMSDPATAGQYLRETSMSSYWYRTE